MLTMLDPVRYLHFICMSVRERRNVVSRKGSRRTLRVSKNGVPQDFGWDPLDAIEAELEKDRADIMVKRCEM